jgi:hypothetical protein
VDTSSTAFKLNLAATILLPCIVPFTFAFIAPVNNKLIEKMNELSSASLEDKAVEAGVAEGETTHALLDKWATLNLLSRRSTRERLLDSRGLGLQVVRTGCKIVFREGSII